MFEGFSKEGRQFLAELAKNNNRAWFDANKPTWHSELLDPAKQFVVAVGAKLKEEVPDINAVPKVNGSIFRINRDTRFSKDKTPYKTHLDLWFWEGEGRSWDCPGFFFRMTPDTLVLGAGMHKFGKEKLAPFRAAVADEERGAALVEVIGTANDAGASLDGDLYKRVPKGYDPEHPRAELLKHKGLTATFTLAPLPDAMGSRRAVDFVLQRYDLLLPLHRWLTQLS